MIELENVTVRYPDAGGVLAVDAASLTVPARRTMVLLGGSGAGKSTLLKAILSLLPLSSGCIRLDGEDIAGMDPVQLRRRIGMVFQGPSLFPHMTVAENIGLPLALAGMPRGAIETRVNAMLELLNLEPRVYALRYPHMLSGGEQQRVGVARALAPEPAYLLMDEPFGALDAITRRDLQEKLKELRRTLDITILFVTHDVMEAVVLADDIAVMAQGRILQAGRVRALMERPANATVEALVTTPLRELSTFVKDSVA